MIILYGQSTTTESLSSMTAADVDSATLLVFVVIIVALLAFPTANSMKRKLGGLTPIAARPD
jgi:hypothetical protein